MPLLACAFERGWARMVCVCACDARRIADVIIALPAGPVCRPPCIHGGKAPGERSTVQVVSKSDEALSTSTPGSTAPGTGRWIPVSLAVFASAWGGNEFTPLLVMYRQDRKSVV